MEPLTTVDLCTGRVGATPPNAIEGTLGRGPREPTWTVSVADAQRYIDTSRSSRSPSQDILTDSNWERFLAS
jgi:hypothetical protein